MMTSPKVIKLETDVILLIMATDFNDLNIDILISVQYEIHEAINLLVNTGDHTDLDTSFMPSIGKMVQRHLLHHISWLKRAMQLQPQCNDVCASRFCLDDYGNGHEGIYCPRENWRKAIIGHTGEYQNIPVLPKKEVVDRCMAIVTGLTRIANLGRFN